MTTEYRIDTPWMSTFTGRRVNPLALTEADIDIKDIAHALALLNRFVGHTRYPISVAQHSLYVSHLCPPTGAAAFLWPRVALQGLLHDASEAYLGDVCKWLKCTPGFAAYREAEARAQACIYATFGLPPETGPEVERADRLMVRYEGYHGYGEWWTPAHPDYPPLTQEERGKLDAMVPLTEMTWREAELKFLWRYEDLLRASEDRLL